MGPMDLVSYAVDVSPGPRSLVPLRNFPASTFSVGRGLQLTSATYGGKTANSICPPTQASLLFQSANETKTQWTTRSTIPPALTPLFKAPLLLQLQNVNTKCAPVEFSSRLSDIMYDICQNIAGSDMRWYFMIVFAILWYGMILPDNITWHIIWYMTNTERVMDVIWHYCMEQCAME